MYNPISNRKQYNGYRVDKAQRMNGNKHKRTTAIIFEDISSGDIIEGKEKFCKEMGITIGKLTNKLLKSRSDFFEEPIEVNGRFFKHKRPLDIYEK
jgi:hypothetical protein